MFAPPEKSSGLLARFIFIATLFFVLAQGILLLALYLKTGNLAEISNIIQLAKEYPVFIKSLQLLQSLIIFLLPALLFPYFSGVTPPAFFPQGKIRISTLFIVFLFVTISIPFVNTLVQINKMLPFSPEVLAYLEAQQDAADHLVKILLSANKGLGGLVLDTLVIAIVPAIAEEFFFRGVLQQILHKMLRNIHVAIILTAFVFSLVHFQFLTFLPRFYLGIVLGYLFYWSRNIWVSITAHFINNFYGVFVSHTLPEGWQDKMDAIGSDISPESLILNFLVVIIIFYAIQKHFEHVKQR